ncbi:transposase [Flexithrix dorotheae]|uniref:transposase n=1 Tax=Flexithrix dorotheae TaxID=70993 RepID=UPI0003614EAE|nr:transposase [Flexithrix dorotheae]
MTIRVPVYSYILGILASYYDLVHEAGSYLLNLKRTDDLFYPCLHAYGKLNSSPFSNPIEMINVNLQGCTDTETGSVEYAIGHAINKSMHVALMREIEVTSACLGISELAAMRMVIDKYNIPEEMYAYESMHKSFIRLKRKRFPGKQRRRYTTGFKKKIAFEVQSGRLTYRRAKLKYKINSDHTIRRWIKKFPIK